MYFKEIKRMDLEGIVAKEINSNYKINQRTQEWIKIKNLKRETFIVGGFIEKEKSSVISLLLGEKKGDNLNYVGRVILSKTNPFYKKIISTKKQKKNSFLDKDIKGTYIELKNSCIIKYLERTKNNHLRQPIFQSEK